MSKLPTIKEMAEKVAKEAIERIYAEKPELKELSEAYEDGFIQGEKETFDVMKENCKHSHFTYDEDSHCSGYNYCRLKGFDCVCSFENCEKIKEQK